MAPRTPANPSRTADKAPRWSVPPVLVRQIRNGVVESVHRGDIVEADASGRLLRTIGDPDRVVFLRSTVKPFGLLALLRAGGQKAFDLTPDEIAIMASSHSGEDVHVRTIQALYRRLAIPTSVLACGTEGMPLEEFKRDRPREYEELVESGRLEEMTMPAPAEHDVRFWKRIGWTALTMGLILIGLIVYAMLFVYR